MATAVTRTRHNVRPYVRTLPTLLPKCSQLPCMGKEQLLQPQPDGVPRCADGSPRRCLLSIKPLNAELNPICYLLALLGAHHFLHVSRIRFKSLTFRLLMSYIYIYIYIYIYMEHPFLMFLDHTQRRTTVGRPPLDE